MESQCPKCSEAFEGYAGAQQQLASYRCHSVFRVVDGTLISESPDCLRRQRDAANRRAEVLEERGERLFEIAHQQPDCLPELHALAHEFNAALADSDAPGGTVEPECGDCTPAEGDCGCCPVTYEIDLQDGRAERADEARARGTAAAQGGEEGA